MFWNLDAGDGLLELVLKAKRGALGLGSLSDASDQVIQTKLRRLLCRLLDVAPSPHEAKARRLLQAIRKAARDMSGGWAGNARALEAAFLAAAADMGHPAVSKHLERMAAMRREEVEEEAAARTDEQMHSA